MSTSPATTATVELLTAEVRTVMIGRRQVTLSVYRQLDRVASEFVEAFGRVRDPAAKPIPGETSSFFDVPVVGRDRRDGALVRSVASPVPTGGEYPDAEFMLTERWSVFYPPEGFGKVVFEGAETTQVRSPGTPYERQVTDWQGPSKVTVASRTANGRTYGVKWVVDGLRSGKSVKWYRHNPDVPPGKVRFIPGIDAADVAARYARELDVLVERDQRRDDWESLPLIVLAGLR